MVAKAIKLAVLGFLVGMVFGAAISIVIGLLANDGSLALSSVLLEGTGSEAGALLAQMLLSGLYGAIPMAGVIVYEFDSWGLLKQAVVHYVTYTVAFMIFGVLVGWIEPTLLDMGIMAGIFLVCHCIIWLIMYARYKTETKELNSLLNEANQEI